MIKKKSRILETKNLSTNMDRSTDTKKILPSKAKFAQRGREGGKNCAGRERREEGKICPKTNFVFCAAILHPLLLIFVKSETPSFHYCSPRIPNL